MKIAIRLIMASLLAAGLTMLSACSNDGGVKSNVNKLNKMEEKYVQACSEKDFDKARSIVEEMKPIISQTQAQMEANVAKGITGSRANLRQEYAALLKPLDTHIKYVNDKEIYDLLAKPSRDNDARIMYLYNTFEKNELPDMEDVVEVAISMGDEYLSEKLIKSGVNPSAKIAKAAVVASMQPIADLVINKNPEILFTPEVGNSYREEFGAEKYLEKLQNTLHNGIDIPKMPPLGIGTDSGYLYRKASEAFNKRCIILIREAVNAGRMDVAQKTLSLMVPNIDEGDSFEKVIDNVRYTYWKITENRSLINEARRIIQAGK